MKYWKKGYLINYKPPYLYQNMLLVSLSLLQRCSCICVACMNLNICLTCSLQIVQMIFGAISRLGAEVGSVKNNFPRNKCNSLVVNHLKLSTILRFCSPRK